MREIMHSSARATLTYYEDPANLPSVAHKHAATIKLAKGAHMKDAKTQSPRVLDLSSISVQRDVFHSARKPIPSQSLTGKGEIGGSNNYAKMNYQNN